jgi:hypothetical protein
VPEWLDEAQRRTYYRELATQLRPIVAKAVWVLEKNLETARRLGYDSEFVARTEVDLTRLSRVLDGDGAALGRPQPRIVVDADAPTSEAAGGVASLDPIEAQDGNASAAGQGPAMREPRNSPEDGLAPADRKLFVPPMTPLVP